MAARASACISVMAWALGVTSAAQVPSRSAAPSSSPAPTAAAPSAPLPAPAAAPSLLPGGATSVQETHGAWLVRCVQREGGKTCSLIQEQIDNNSRHRLLALELTATAPDAANGVLVLPFGLSLDKGVSLHVDDKSPGPTMRFRTCLPAGCVVDVTWDRDMVSRVKSGAKLAVRAFADGGGAVDFSLALSGFAGAIERTYALSR